MTTQSRPRSGRNQQSPRSAASRTSTASSPGRADQRGDAAFLRAAMTGVRPPARDACARSRSWLRQARCRSPRLAYAWLAVAGAFRAGARELDGSESCCHRSCARVDALRCHRLSTPASSTPVIDGAAPSCCCGDLSRRDGERRPRPCGGRAEPAGSPQPPCPMMTPPPRPSPQ